MFKISRDCIIFNAFPQRLFLRIGKPDLGHNIAYGSPAYHGHFSVYMEFFGVTVSFSISLGKDFGPHEID